MLFNIKNPFKKSIAPSESIKITKPGAMTLSHDELLWRVIPFLVQRCKVDLRNLVFKQEIGGHRIYTVRSTTVTILETETYYEAWVNSFDCDFRELLGAKLHTLRTMKVNPNEKALRKHQERIADYKRRIAEAKPNQEYKYHTRIQK